MRYGREVLKSQECFFSGLVSTIVEVMGNTFLEMKQHEENIKEIIVEEELSFGRTLIKGIEKFKKVAQDVKDSKLSGQDAFILWDIYRFLIDLTHIMAEVRGLEVDIDGFNSAMEKAMQKARNARELELWHFYLCK